MSPACCRAPTAPTTSSEGASSLFEASRVSGSRKVVTACHAAAVELVSVSPDGSSASTAEDHISARSRAVVMVKSAGTTRRPR